MVAQNAICTCSGVEKRDIDDLEHISWGKHTTFIFSTYAPVRHIATIPSQKNYITMGIPTL